MLFRITLVTLLLFCSVVGACAQPPKIAELVSPKGTWKVTFHREEAAYNQQHVSMAVLNIPSNRISHMPGPIYFEGTFDPTFEQTYPMKKWVEENALWLGSRTDTAIHRIVIRNDSDEVISMVRVKSEDLYFAFDLAPETSIEFPVRWTDNGRTKVFLTTSVSKKSGLEVTNSEFEYPAGRRTYLVKIGLGSTKIVDQESTFEKFNQEGNR